MTKRPSREFLQRHRRVQSVNPPMPPDDASDAEWDAWMELQDLQAILGGLVSRGSESPALRDEATEWHRDVRAYLAKPAVLALLGDAAKDAWALAADLGVQVDG